MIKSRKVMISLFILVSLINSAGAVYAGGAVVYLKQYLAVQNNEITAKSILRSKVLDSDTAAALQRAVILNVYGGAVIYPVKTLYRLLQNTIPEPLSLVGDKIIIFRDTVLDNIDRETFLSVADALWRKYGMKDGKLEFELKRDSGFKGNVKEAAGHEVTGSKQEIDIVGYSDKPLKCMIYIKYRSKDNNKQLQKYYADIKRFIPVAYAVKTIRAGELLSGKSVEYRDKEVDKLSGGMFYRTFATSGENLTGYRASAVINSGEPILKRNIKPYRAVRSGERISINFIGRGIKVTMKGYALSAGGINTEVRVKPYESRNIFRGIVKDKGVVDVALP
ncbi:MAG: flagellar basal body P-ring formation protein FlgA [Spirochaetes bacterium]|nr:flagellar basal body P-ring formation protein FlgA [Spirochaetota bacterium]